MILQPSPTDTAVEGLIYMHLFASEKAYKDKEKTVQGDYLSGTGVILFLLLLYFLFL